MTIQRLERSPALRWRRDRDLSFQAWIDELDPACLPSARLVLHPDEVREAVTEVCKRAGTPSTPERTHLIEDVDAISTLFADLLQYPFLRLRFDVINTNACCKFHMDMVKARLICTYRGTGTQYGFAQWDRAPTQIRTVPTGSPIVLRGKHWPMDHRLSLLHRSPQIEGTGETRLLLVLDPVQERTNGP